MSEWTGPQRKLLHQALLAAFPTLPALRRMVSYELDLSLDALTAPGSLSDVLFELIEWAVAQYRVPDLLQAACAANPDHPQLQELAAGGPGLPKPADHEIRLRALLVDHTSFIRDRLNSFVGREPELAEIRRRIAEALPAGGYLTITGQAGQGKSSLIARLVQDRLDTGEQVAYHFIPFNPGPDHQVGLLRNLMARLILKHNLSDIYVASESRPALRDYFPNLLAETAQRGQQEIIYIDGLDQIEPDINGERDLSFLPTDPPIGILFVLSTRPDDTLRPLELRKARVEYALPNLSRADFDQILQHRQADLRSDLADRFYEAMVANALYLDLVAQELAQTSTTNPESIIQRVTDDPGNLFSFALDRLQRHKDEWSEVIYPLLGVLLTAQEPLSIGVLRRLIRGDQATLRAGLSRLGGLLAQDGQGRRYLFHLKLHEYLQGAHSPEEAKLFASEEITGWHRHLAAWCEQGGLDQIWQDLPNDVVEHSRRIYARQHYITHLYHAQEWTRLCNVLDAGIYGQAKIRWDPSNHSYATDLDLGRQVAAHLGHTLAEGLSSLPYLWRYTLLRSSLSSQADNYPSELFTALVWLGRWQEAINRAEMLTDPVRKAMVLGRIAEALAAQADQQNEATIVLRRAYETLRQRPDLEVWQSLLKVTDLQERSLAVQVEDLAYAIIDPKDQATALIMLAGAFAQAGQIQLATHLWTEAEDIARSARGGWGHYTLAELAGALAKAEQFTQARLVTDSIVDTYSYGPAQALVAEALAQTGQFAQAEALARTITPDWLQPSVLETIVKELIHAKQFAQAEALARTITSYSCRATALATLATALVQEGQMNSATRLWAEAESTARKHSSFPETLAAVYAEIIQFAQGETLEDVLTKAETWAEEWGRARPIPQGEAAERAIVMAERYTAALMIVVEAFLHAGQFARLEAVTRTFTDARKNQMTLQLLAEALGRAGQFTWAEALTYEITHTRVRGQTLSVLAETMAQAGLAEPSTHLWAEAEVMLRGTIEATEDNKLLDAMVKILIQAREYTQAEVVARSITVIAQREKALKTLVNTLVKVGEYTQAEVIARTITSAEVRDEILEVLARSLVEAELFAQAEAVVGLIADIETCVRVLATLAGAMNRAMQVEATTRLWAVAEEAARTIANPQKRSLALAILAKGLMQAKQLDIAARLWSEANNVSGMIGEAKSQAKVLIVLVRSLIEVGEPAQAEALMHQIEDPECQDMVAVALVEALGQAKQFAQAETVAQAIKNLSHRDAAWGVLSGALAQAEQFQEAEILTRRITHAQEQIEALTMLIAALTQSGQFTQAEALVAAIPDHWYQTSAQGKLIKALVQAGQFIQAEALVHAATDRDYLLGILIQALAQAEQFTQAETLIRTITNERERDPTLAALANALSQAGWFAEAEPLAHAIVEPKIQATTLVTLAKALTQAGQVESAIHLWAEAKAAVDKIDNATERVEALGSLIQAWVQDEQLLQAFQIVRQELLQAHTRQETVELLGIITPLIAQQPELGIALVQGLVWVDRFLRGETELPGSSLDSNDA